MRSLCLIAAALSLSNLKLVAAGALRPHSLSARVPGPAPALCQMTCKPHVPQHAAPGRRPSFLLPPRGRMPPAFLPCPEPARTILMGPCQMSATCLLTSGTPKRPSAVGCLCPDADRVSNSAACGEAGLHSNSLSPPVPGGFR